MELERIHKSECTKGTDSLDNLFTAPETVRLGTDSCWMGTTAEEIWWADLKNNMKNYWCMERGFGSGKFDKYRKKKQLYIKSPT